MCMSCVGRDVTSFLPKPMIKRFEGFHQSFSEHFDSAQLVLNGEVNCVNCRSTKESPVCPNCYTLEVHSWLRERDSGLASKFKRMFSFTGQSNISPEGDFSDEESGICDECGEYTENLTLVDGEWICGDCGPIE